MSPGKGDPAPVPPIKGEYEIRFASRTAAEGWMVLYKQAPGNTREAWYMMRTNPCPNVPTQRHHRLKYELASGTRSGKSYPQWQIEVTGGGRIWYLLDQNAETCWVVQAGTRHPRQTD